MKHIFQVFRYEYLTCVKNKAFIITTVIFIALILLLSFVPMIVMSIAKGDDADGEAEIPVIAVSSSVYDKKDLENNFQKAYENYEIQVTDENTDVIKAKVDDATYDFAIVIKDRLSYTFITKNNSMFSTEGELDTIGDTIKNLYRVSEFEKQGISAKDSEKILNSEVHYETVTTGKDQTKNYLSTYILIMILYMAIIMYGQMVSQSVVSEKNTRAMEMLITCAKPTHLIFGKVFGSGLAGLTQLILITGTSVISVGAISSQSIPDEIKDIISFPVQTVIYALIFFLLGYFIYSFLMGALSSFASRSEDLNTLISPVMLLFVAAFMIVVFSINLDGVDSTLMIVCSYIPFTAPMCMFARVAMSDVAFYEIIISIAVQLISVYLFGLLAGAIYKIGVLMYGNPPKPLEIIKLLITQHKENKLAKSQK